METPVGENGVAAAAPRPASGHPGRVHAVRPRRRRGHVADRAPGLLGQCGGKLFVVDRYGRVGRGFSGVGAEAELLLIAARASPARTAFDVRVLSRCSYLTPSAGLGGADAGIYVRARSRPGRCDATPWRTRAASR